MELVVIPKKLGAKKISFDETSTGLHPLPLTYINRDWLMVLSYFGQAEGGEEYILSQVSEQNYDQFATAQITLKELLENEETKAFLVLRVYTDFEKLQLIEENFHLEDDSDYGDFLINEME